jgi:hypothetical protein
MKEDQCMAGPASVQDIINAAEKFVGNAGSTEEALFAAMGIIGNDAPKANFLVTHGMISLDAAAMALRGRELFAKFRGALQQAVCQDFSYCAKRAQVDQALKNYLPDIVKCILVRIPMSDKLPDWLPPVLGMFGISATSLDVVVGFLVAWLLIKGCNELCACPNP